MLVEFCTDFQLYDTYTFTCSSIDLILERLCLEGSRRQAKYAVHALAAITKDDGLKSLSVLYKVSYCYRMRRQISLILLAFASNDISQFVEACGYAGGEDTFACCATIIGLYS